MELCELHISLHHSFVTQTVHNAFHRSPFSISEGAALPILDFHSIVCSNVKGGPCPTVAAQKQGISTLTSTANGFDVEIADVFRSTVYVSGQPVQRPGPPNIFPRAQDCSNVHGAPQQSCRRTFGAC